MPHSVRPGDVLADRYRLVDLLSESGGGRFWRAHDRVLQRHVALHVIGADDERADGLLEAARRSATVLDPRLLRVLDAERVEDLCYVVNEWGTGVSLDLMLATNGPLPPRSAAWLVAEVADSVARAHARGVAHGRLVPENVLVERSGAIKVIGFSVDAALHGLEPDRTSADVTDLAALAYSSLTGRWPGTTPSDVAAAPRSHGRVLRPRQVRAGIPRVLDDLCDDVLNRSLAGSSPSRDVRSGIRDRASARGLESELREFVGDPAGVPEAVAAHTPPRSLETVVLPSVPEFTLRPDSADGFGPEPDPEPSTEPDSQPASGPPSEPTDAHVGPDQPDPDPDEGDPDDVEPTVVVSRPDTAFGPDAGPRPSSELPTQAGMPIFHEEDDEVAWLTARSEPAPPPPPFEDPPERPLFAPEPSDGTPPRKPRPRAAGAAASLRSAGHAAFPEPGEPYHVDSSTGAGEYWPWDTGRGTGTGLSAIGEEEVPGRSWFRLALAIGAALLLLVAIVVAYNLGRGKTPLGAEPAEPSATPSATTSTDPTASPTPVTGLAAADLDPQGSPPEENPDRAALAVDQDQGTSWPTQTYNQNFGPGGLKDGVGLVVDLGESRSVSEIDLLLVGAATDVSLFLTDETPTDVDGLDPLSEVSAASREEIVLDEPATGRYLTVWLTSLPPTDDGRFRGEIAEVVVRG